MAASISDAGIRICRSNSVFEGSSSNAPDIRRCLDAQRSISRLTMLAAGCKFRPDMTVSPRRRVISSGAAPLRKSDAAEESPRPCVRCGDPRCRWTAWSTTPRATLRKLPVDIVVMGECEQSCRGWRADGDRDLPASAFGRVADPRQGVSSGGRSWELPALRGRTRDPPAPASSPSLRWRAAGPVLRSRHRAAVRTIVRSAPRTISAIRYPKAALEVVAGGDRPVASSRASNTCTPSTRYSCRTEDLLEAHGARGFKFGVQTRLDLWKPELIEMLGRAGCVSIEAGVESLSAEGRARVMDKNCRSGDRGADATSLLLARQHVPFVQANLIRMGRTRRFGCGPPVARAAADRRGCGRTIRCRCFRIPPRPIIESSGRPGRSRLGARAQALSAAIRINE